MYTDLALGNTGVNGHISFNPGMTLSSCWLSVVPPRCLAFIVSPGPARGTLLNFILCELERTEEYTVNTVQNYEMLNSVL